MSNLFPYLFFRLSAVSPGLLTLHRPYCVEALKDRTASLDDHAYRHSVVAVSRSTSALIHALRLTWGRAPRLLGEMSLPWSQLLTTSVSCLRVRVMTRQIDLSPSDYYVLNDGICTHRGSTKVVHRPSEPYIYTISRCCCFVSHRKKVLGMYGFCWGIIALRALTHSLSLFLLAESSHPNQRHFRRL